MTDPNGITSLATARALREIAEEDAQLDIYYPDGGPQSDAYYRAVATHHVATVTQLRSLRLVKAVAPEPSTPSPSTPPPVGP